jgi:hypothetical protein
MGAVKHAVRVVEGGGYAMPVRRRPPLVVWYEHFRLDRQGQLLSLKTRTWWCGSWSAQACAEKSSADLPSSDRTGYRA